MLPMPLEIAIILPPSAMGESTALLSW